MDQPDLSQFAQCAAALGMTADQLRAALCGPPLVAALYGLMHALKFAYKKTTHMYWWATTPAPTPDPVYTEYGKAVLAVLHDHSEAALNAWEFSQDEKQAVRTVGSVRVAITTTNTFLDGISHELLTEDDKKLIRASRETLWTQLLKRRADAALATIAGAAAPAVQAAKKPEACPEAQKVEAAAAATPAAAVGARYVPTGNLCEWFVRQYGSDAWVQFYGVMTGAQSGAAEGLLTALGWDWHTDRENTPHVTLLKAGCTCPGCVRKKAAYATAADRLRIPAACRVTA